MWQTADRLSRQQYSWSAKESKTETTRNGTCQKCQADQKACKQTPRRHENMQQDFHSEE